MTGDETNKPCEICSTIKCPSHQIFIDDPVASNAWAHKRIAELEDRNTQMQIDNSRGTYTPFHEADRKRLLVINASLESSLEGMKKRNEELSKELEIRDQLWVPIQNLIGSGWTKLKETEAKLKITEDKLADYREALEKISRLENSSERSLGDYTKIAKCALSKEERKINDY